MKLRFRILTLSGIIGFLFLSVLGYNLVFFATASRDLNSLLGTNLEVVQRVDRMNQTLLTIRAETLDSMVLTPEEREGMKPRLEALSFTFYGELRQLVQINPDLEPLVRDLRSQFQPYVQFARAILESRTLEEFASQRDLVVKFRNNQESLSNLLNETVTREDQEFRETINTFEDDFNRTLTLDVLASLLVLILAVALSFWLAGRLAQPVEALTMVARQVSERNFQVRPPLSSGGEIRDLGQAFTLMLEEIQSYSTHMEDLVRFRTEELASANATMVKELKLARKIQEALIPGKEVSQDGFWCAGRFLPMEELGGDLYDIFTSEPGVWNLVIADVSGHGVPAALVTAMVKISFQIHCLPGLSPGEVLDQVNRELVASIGDTRQYVTMVYAQVDLNRGEIRYSSAGHNEIILLRKTGQKEILEPNSGVVGMNVDEIFLTSSVTFAPGDTLVLFTDGVIDARSRSRELFGLERMMDLLAQGTRSPSDLVRTVLEKVQNFLDGQPPQDDITILAARWDPALPAKDVHTAGLVTDPRDSLDPVLRARAFFAAGEYPVLLSWLGERLAEEPEDRRKASLLYWKAMALYRQGNLTGAAETWKVCLDLNPDHRRAARALNFVTAFLNRRSP